MKKAIWAAALLAGACFSGLASAGTVESSFGNTILITDAQGAQSRIYLEADGSYRAVFPGGVQANGIYEVNGGQFCMTPAGGARACSPYIDGKNVGDSWTQNDFSGAPTTLTIVAGR